MKRLVDAEYDHLLSIMDIATVGEVEASMRRIHIYNFKIRAYGLLQQKQVAEVFNDD